MIFSKKSFFSALLLLIPMVLITLGLAPSLSPASSLSSEMTNAMQDNKKSNNEENQRSILYGGRDISEFKITEDKQNSYRIDAGEKFMI